MTKPLLKALLNESRLILGTARYPSLQILTETVKESGAKIVTVSLRRETGKQNFFWESLQKQGLVFLPNTAGCRSVKEAVTTAKLARECFQTNWIKLEITGEETSLAPNPFALVEAARVLQDLGFEVFPYFTDDIVVGRTLIEIGCRVLMPWAAPIGSGRGLECRSGLIRMRKLFPETLLIVDAGLGKPSQAAEVMELGFDGVMLNSAVAKAEKPVEMGMAFAFAVKAGRMGFEAGMMKIERDAVASTPDFGLPFWHKTSREERKQT